MTARRLIVVAALCVACPAVAEPPEPREALSDEELLQALEREAPPAEAPTAAAEVPAGPWRAIDLTRLGFDARVKRYATSAALAYPFHARGDEVITAARLRLSFSPAIATEVGLAGLEVSVNHEVVAHIPAERIRQGGGEVTIPIDAPLVGVENALTLRLVLPPNAPCTDPVPQGAWQVVDAAALDVKTSGLPLSNDLEMLPLPFYDHRTDAAARVPVVLTMPLTPESLSVASLVGAWFGLHAGSETTFEVHVGALPDESAVVLALAGDTLAGHALGATRGPTLRMMDHPRFPKSNRKLLVISGESLMDLRLAALTLALGRPALEGPVVSDLSEPVAGLDRAAYVAPRWLPPDQSYRLSDLAGAEQLTHEGLQGGSMAVSFRVAPDLFAWPSETVRLDVAYSQQVSDGVEPPPITVELNGRYLATLKPVRTAPEDEPAMARLQIPRAQLRGFNRLEFHVAAVPSEALCQDRPSDTARAVIEPGTTLHLADLPHFAPMPNLGLFIDDGYPFTVHADLSRTAVVLPERVSPPEAATLLSLMAHFAAITGYPGTRATFVTAATLGGPGVADRDLLVVGTPQSSPLFAAWAPRLPLAWTTGPPKVNGPEGEHWVREALQGRDPRVESRRAQTLLRGRDAFRAVMGLASPLNPRRSAVIVTASDARGMPAMTDLQGSAESRFETADLLLVTEGRRAMFHIRPGYQVGEVSGWTRARWLLARHWVLLVPCCLLGALLWGLALRSSLSHRAQARLVPRSGREGEP